jgi:glutathione S-transferase
MITLYHRPRTRSSRFIFLLEELGAPYEIRLVTTLTADGTGARDPANPHPHGKVPAISDDGEVVFESAAIALYLTDKFPEKGLGPKAGEKGRGAYLSWLAYYAGGLEPAVMSKFMKITVPRGTAGWVDADEAMDTIVKTLTQRPYIAGDSFTGADVLYATSFALFAGSPLIPKSDALEAYVKRCLDRPAYARAQARDNG